MINILYQATFINLSIIWFYDGITIVELDKNIRLKEKYFEFLNIDYQVIMPELNPANRLQFELSSLEDVIEKDNVVRFINAFVDKLNLSELKFQITSKKTEGRPTTFLQSKASGRI